MRNTVRDNVAEHSYYVAAITHMLCTIGNELYGRKLPTEQLVTQALFHDSTEVITGDIPAPIKHHNGQILNSFRHIEHLAAERLLSMIPDELKEAYTPLLQPKQSIQADLPYQEYIKAADLIDAYLKCVSELAVGNQEFSVAKEQICTSIKKLGLPEVDYFLTHLAPSFEKTLDELFSTEDSDTP